MKKINVERISPAEFKVTISSRTTTTHIVTITPAQYKALSGGHITEEELVKRSFEFLLDREPNTSILRKFELSVIGHYFPEYERTMKGQL